MKNALWGFEGAVSQHRWSLNIGGLSIRTGSTVL